MWAHSLTLCIYVCMTEATNSTRAERDQINVRSERASVSVYRIFVGCAITAAIAPQLLLLLLSLSSLPESVSLSSCVVYCFFICTHMCAAYIVDGGIGVHVSFSHRCVGIGDCGNGFSNNGMEYDLRTCSLYLPIGDFISISPLRTPTELFQS